MVGPTAVADALLFSLLKSGAEALWVTPTEPTSHAVVLDFARGSVTATRIECELADAVVARLALIAEVNFTARDPRSAPLHLTLGGARHELRLEVRPVRGHLLAHVRRALPHAEPKLYVGDPESALRAMEDYEIFEEIGRGAMGVVFRARHRLLYKQVAIKVWSQASLRTDVANASLLHEARVANATRHSGVVDIYDLLRLPDGRTALVMELLDGEPLSERLKCFGALEVEEALRVAKDITGVLVATHAAGVIHRDLKPSNVFLLRDGRLKLLDFGAAVDQFESPDQRPVALGTPWYMAPEQARYGAPDERSDIYSVGCILYEMLAGHCPFDGVAEEVMRKHQHEPIPPPSSPYTALPDELQRILEKALAKLPSQRQQSAFELSMELESAASAWARQGFRKWLPP